MGTPTNAPYKKAQRAAEAGCRRYNAIWTSCYTEAADQLGSFWKHTVQGTCRVRLTQNRTRGKAAIKAQEKRIHYPRHYQLMKVKHIGTAAEI